jgi:outer membrane protein/protease secretion system outer membrane protein
MTAISSSYSSKAIGLQLTVPLFAGGAVLSQVRQATAALTQAEQTLEAQRMDISSKVYHEYRGITEGALKVHALELAVKSSAQLVESAFKSYKAGFRTQVDVLNSEQQNVKNQEDLAQARYMYVMSWIRLWSLVNQADDVRMSQVNSWLTSP